MDITARELKQLLTPIHLYYDLGSASLRARAMGEIITKVLYLAEGRSLKLEQIAEQAAELVEVKRIPKEDISDGLEFLLDKNIVTNLSSTNLWTLTKEAVEQIDNSIKNSQFRSRKILENHFNRKIDQEKLTKWFRVANADFFGAYGEIWVKTIYCDKSIELPAKSFLKKILTPSIKKYGLEFYFDDLIEGYCKFLFNAGEQINTAQIWSFAQAMLSAKLIMVGVGPDPITIREFKGASLFLDTNILVDIILKIDGKNEAFLNLAEAFKDLGITLCITERTKEEYRNVVRREKEKITKLVKTLSRETLRNVLLDSRDQFALAAISRGCSKLRSYEKFFDDIKNPPSELGGIKIRTEDSAEIEKTAKESERYTKRQNEVADEWLKYYPWPKSTHAIEHDVTLDAVVDCLRKEKPKVWVLTADRSMQSLSQKWAINAMPAWISFDTMIHLLAVYGAGPKHDPSNFAPLLSKLIRAEIQLTEDLYSLEDVIELVDIEERSKELSKEDIEALAGKIAKARVAGKSRYDRELSLEINRVLQRKKITRDFEVQQIKQRTTNLEGELTYEQVRKNAILNVLVKKLAERKKLQERIKYLFVFIGLLTIGALLIFFGACLLEIGAIAFGSICIGLGLSEIILPIFKWIIPEWRKSTKKAEIWAAEQANGLINLEEKRKR